MELEGDLVWKGGGFTKEEGEDEDDAEEPGGEAAEGEASDAESADGFWTEDEEDAEGDVGEIDQEHDQEWGAGVADSSEGAVTGVEDAEEGCAPAEDFEVLAGVEAGFLIEPEGVDEEGGGEVEGEGGEGADGEAEEDALGEGLPGFGLAACSGGTGDDGLDAGGGGALEDHEEPGEVSAEAEGIDDGDFFGAVGHAGGDDEVGGGDHEAEDLL